MSPRGVLGFAADWGDRDTVENAILWVVLSVGDGFYAKFGVG